MCEEGGPCLSVNIPPTSLRATLPISRGSVAISRGSVANNEWTELGRDGLSCTPRRAQSRSCGRTRKPPSRTIPHWNTGQMGLSQSISKAHWPGHRGDCSSYRDVPSHHPDDEHNPPDFANTRLLAIDFKNARSHYGSEFLFRVSRLRPLRARAVHILGRLRCLSDTFSPSSSLATYHFSYLGNSHRSAPVAVSSDANWRAGSKTKPESSHTMVGFSSITLTSWYIPTSLQPF